MGRVLLFIVGLGIMFVAWHDDVPELFMLGAAFVCAPCYLADTRPARPDFQSKDWAIDMCLAKGLTANCAKHLRAYMAEPGPVAVFELEDALNNALGLFPEARGVLVPSEAVAGPVGGKRAPNPDDPLRVIYDAIAGVYRVPTHITVPERELHYNPDSGHYEFFDGMTWLPVPEPESWREDRDGFRV